MVVFIASSARAITFVERHAAARGLPAATLAAAFMRLRANSAATGTAHAFSVSAVASAAADSAMPRCFNWPRSSSHALANRLASELFGQPSSRGLLVRLAFQVTEHDGGPILVRQAAQLFVEDRAQLLPGHFIERFGARHVGCPPFPVTSCGDLDLRLAGNPLGDAVQPTGHRGVLANGSGACARTRKVAWKASSAAWASPAMRWQTPSTIGPCRCMSISNAASSRPLRKRSSKAPSLGPWPSWTADARRRKRNRSVRIPCGMYDVSGRCCTFIVPAGGRSCERFW